MCTVFSVTHLQGGIILFLGLTRRQLVRNRIKHHPSALQAEHPSDPAHVAAPAALAFLVGPASAPCGGGTTLEPPPAPRRGRGVEMESAGVNAAPDPGRARCGPGGGAHAQACALTDQLPPVASSPPPPGRLEAQPCGRKALLARKRLWTPRHQTRCHPGGLCPPQIHGPGMGVARPRPHPLPATHVGSVPPTPGRPGQTPVYQGTL